MTAFVSSAALTRAELEHAPPRTVRMAVREGRWTTNTKRLALGFHQANVTILPERLAFDFMRFCQRNPRALPILDVTDPGDPVPRTAAPDADIRLDIPGYCIYRDGKLVNRVRDLRDHWRSDHVAFLTGCNLSMDQVLLDAGIPFPHLVREDAFPAQYRSSFDVPAGGSVQRPRGCQLSAGSRASPPQGHRIDVAISSIPWSADTRRRPRPHRHCRPCQG